MVRSPFKRSNNENVEDAESNSPAKFPKLVLQKLSNRRVLGGIPTPPRPSSSQGSQGRATTSRQAREDIRREKAQNALRDKTKQSNKVAALLKSVLTKTQQTQAEPELAREVEDQSSTAEPTSGLIKSVTLYNFMCHESFHKEFHPNLNFITGENGSGKSAVLSGILVGLGARALTTARTKSIKSLVKTGKDFAKIEIALINRGLLDVEKYGETFIIERVIDSKGSSTYKLKSYGKARPLRKSELEYILMTLGIQLDNPVAILNQETARSFLRSKDPRDKYKLFYEGTLLRSCDDLLKESKRNIAASRENFEKSKEIINAQTDELERLKSLMRKIAQVDDMKRKTNTLEIESAWSKVTAAENALSNFRKTIGEKTQKLKKFEDASQGLVQERQALYDEASPNNNQKEILGKELQTKQSILEDTRQQYTRLKRNMSEKKVTIQMGQGRLAKINADIRELERTIERLRQDSQNAADEKKREIALKKEQLEFERGQLKSEISTLKTDGEQFRHGAETCRNEMNQLDDEMRQLTLQISHKKTELDRINQRTANKYAIFGREMETLVAKIKANQNSFRKLPRGPIGSCFTVKNPKWLPIIEHYLGNVIHNFVVDNSEDSILLNKLISQVFGRSSIGGGPGGCKRPNVLLSEFGSGAFDISKGNASMRNHPTILDVLRFEDDDFVVKNALCDFAKVERILLFEQKTDALEILKNSNTPGFPRTCQAGFSLDFYKITPDPQFRCDVLHNKGGHRFLKSDQHNLKKTLKDEIVALEAQCKELRPRIDGRRKQELEFRKELSQRDEKKTSLARKYHELGVEMENLNKTRTRGPDINNYIEELTERQSELTSLTEEMEEAEKFINEKTAVVTSLEENKTTIETEIQDIREKISKLEGCKDSLKGKIEKINMSIQKFVNLTRQIQSEKEILEREKEEHEADLQRKIAEAEEVGPRVQTTRETKDIRSEIGSLKAKIEEAEKHLGDRKKISKELKEARAKYETFRNEFKTWYTLFQVVRATIAAQDKQFHKSISTVTTSLQSCFKGLIATRGYKGTLTIDNETKELFYFVCPDAASNSRIAKVLSTNDTKVIKNFLGEYGLGLSGGECSFSTICFIIAMWQAMQCPFFMLDEFDVFMDAFNRKASQNALISHAKSHNGRQFFLLSPLELTEIPEEGTAMVLKMFPPVRDKNNDNDPNSDGSDADSSDSPPQPGPSKRGRRN